MNKELIEKIAMDVSGSTPEDMHEEAWIKWFAHRFLERIDAERDLPQLIPPGMVLVPIDHKKDAERYLWLRDRSVGPGQIWELLSDDCNPPILTLKSMDDLDSAIDKAMVQAAQGGK